MSNKTNEALASTMKAGESKQSSEADSYATYLEHISDDKKTGDIQS